MKIITINGENYIITYNEKVCIDKVVPNEHHPVRIGEYNSLQDFMEFIKSQERSIKKVMMVKTKNNCKKEEEK